MKAKEKKINLRRVLTALDLDGAVLGVEGVIVQVHHASQGRGEPHAVRDQTVARKPHELVALRHVVQKAANNNGFGIFF